MLTRETQIAMFRARYNSDSKTLCALHPQFLKAKNYPAALLCLDQTFSSTLPQHGTTVVDPGPGISLNFAYFELLDRLRREDHLDPGSIRQKIFAFQSREDDRFFIPTNSFLHIVFALKPDALQEKGGCIVTHEELKHTLDREIPEYIRLRAKDQHNAYRRKLGAIPVSQWQQGENARNRTANSSISGPRRSQSAWFNARIQSVLTEIRILNLTGFHPRGVIMCVYR
jgi:hypothetical protein